MRRATLALVVVVGALSLAGCKKKPREGPPPRPAPMPEVEVTRGRAACDDLVARLCACAQAQPGRADLADACQMKKAKPEALALMLETAQRDDVAPDAVVRSQQAARKIIEKCIQEVAALPTLGCQ
ncbi:MAG: hypothetical protein IPL61_30775 [Myxococcales bacterium]|nr:hypothetical protein [Myxococcales bacterium]